MKKLETLSTALTAHAQAEASADPFALPRAENRLLDACIACGMSLDEPAMVEWASARVTRWLRAA